MGIEKGHRGPHKGSISRRESRIVDAVSSISEELRIALVEALVNGNPRPLAELGKKRPESELIKGAMPALIATGRTVKIKNDPKQFKDPSGGLYDGGFIIDFEQHPIPRFENHFKKLPKKIRLRMQKEYTWDEFRRLPRQEKNKILEEIWEKASSILLANNGSLVDTAASLPGGGILFGIDREGNLLFTSKESEPIYCGYNYMQIERMLANKQFEMFPVTVTDDNRIEMGDEMQQLCAQREFVASMSEENTWRKSWLAGKGSDGQRPVVHRDPWIVAREGGNSGTHMELIAGNSTKEDLGVRPLFRAKEEQEPRRQTGPNSGFFENR